jgi:YD repeat-containing protein
MNQRKDLLTAALVVCAFVIIALSPEKSAANEDCEPGVWIADGTNGDCPAGGTIIFSDPSNIGGPSSVTATLEEIIVVGKRNDMRSFSYELDVSQLSSGMFKATVPNPPPPKEDTEANAGSCDEKPLNGEEGDPVSALNGEKLSWATDYKSGDRLPIEVSRQYAVTDRNTIEMFGRGWNMHGSGRLWRIPVGDPVDGYEKVNVRDSISGYSFIYDTINEEVKQRAGYATQASLELTVVDDLDSWVLKHPDGSYSIFSADPNYYEGRLLVTYSNNGQFLVYKYHGIYNSIEHPKKIEHSSGAYVDFTYQVIDGEYVVSSMANALGDTWQYQYDTDARLEYAYDPLDYRVEYQYDLQHRLTGVVSKAGNLVGEWTYDSGSRVLTSSKYDGSQLVTFDYQTPPFGAYQFVVINDEFGRERKYTSGVFNGRTYLMSVSETADTTCPSSVSTADYYADTGLPYYVTTTAGLKTSYTYDSQYRPETVTLQDVSTNEFDLPDRQYVKTYKPNLPYLNDVTFKVDGASIFKKEFDFCTSTNLTCRDGLILEVSTHDLVNSVGPVTTTYSYSFGEDHQIDSVTKHGPRAGDVYMISFDADGREYQYFANSRLTKTISDYSIDGRPKTIEYPGLYSDSIIYDELGRAKQLTRTAQNDVHVYKYTYNEDGQLSGIESPDEVGKVGAELGYTANGQFSQRRYTSPLPPPPPPPPPCPFPCFEEQ